jgi:hypothetical protein
MPMAFMAASWDACNVGVSLIRLGSAIPNWLTLEWAESAAVAVSRALVLADAAPAPVTLSTMAPAAAKATPAPTAAASRRRPKAGSVTVACAVLLNFLWKAILITCFDIRFV